MSKDEIFKSIKGMMGPDNLELLRYLINQTNPQLELTQDQMGVVASAMNALHVPRYVPDPTKNGEDFFNDHNACNLLVMPIATFMNSCRSSILS